VVEAVEVPVEVPVPVDVPVAPEVLVPAEPVVPVPVAVAVEALVLVSPTGVPLMATSLIEPRLYSSTETVACFPAAVTT
jgi:hypothetical protein